MAVSIKDPDTDHLIRELARRTGETQVAAVKVAVMERLARLDREQDRLRHSRRDRLQAIARDTVPRTRRRERSERAFLFDSELNLVAEFERPDWESALSSCGGDPVRA
jgi:hypothetical protein